MQNNLKVAAIVRQFCILGIILFQVAGCTGISNTPTGDLPTATVTVDNIPTPTALITPLPEGPITLRIWLPPLMNPQEDTPAGRLLKARLEEFTTRRPGVKIEVRIKAQEGPGGLYDSLTTASAAAPQTLPDLVALPRPTLEAAAQKGILHTYDGITTILEDADWYEFARQLARVQNSIFGIPFAADFLVMAYHSTDVSAPPNSLEAAIPGGKALLFPAADPQALFSIVLYLSAGGRLTDDQGKPYLDQQALLQVLRTYQNAQNNAVLPYWLTQYQTYSQIWQAYTENRSNIAVIWLSDYLNNQLENTQIAPIPTLGKTSLTLASGWVWAFTSSENGKIDLTVELADFLSSGSFVANLASALDQLPARQSTLNFWENTGLRTTADQIARTAIVFPPAEILTIIEPPVYEATIQVLKDQIDPAKAVQQAIDSLKNP